MATLKRQTSKPDGTTVALPEDLARLDPAAWASLDETAVRHLAAGGTETHVGLAGFVIARRRWQQAVWAWATENDVARGRLVFSRDGVEVAS